MVDKLKKVTIPKRPKSAVSLWLRIASYVIAGFSILGGYSEGSSGFLLGVVIALGCAYKCGNWAVEIKKSPNWAYVIGFVFGLFGLLGYYIYYKREKKK